jgi:hypothetical protein
MIYDIGGWFYKPESKVMYVIKSNSGYSIGMSECRENDTEDAEFYYPESHIANLLNEHHMYYIPHTKDYDTFMKQIFAINLKHDFSDSESEF